MFELHPFKKDSVPLAVAFGNEVNVYDILVIIHRVYDDIVSEAKYFYSKVAVNTTIRDHSKSVVNTLLNFINKLNRPVWIILCNIKQDGIQIG